MVGPEELNRVIRHAIYSVLLVSGILWIVWDVHHAAGFAFGGLWSSINLWVLQRLIGEVFHSRRIWKVALFAQLKLPVLYGIGALILMTVPLSIGAGICGFHIPFVLIVAESIYYQNRELTAEKTT